MIDEEASFKNSTNDKRVSYIGSKNNKSTLVAPNASFNGSSKKLTELGSKSKGSSKRSKDGDCRIF